MKTALLVIDTQQSLLDMQPYRAEEMLAVIGQLLATARAHGRTVIYVRHGDENDPHSSPAAPAGRLPRASPRNRVSALSTNNTAAPSKARICWTTCTKTTSAA